MDYYDVKTGKDFQIYVKERGMITSCLSEKYLELVRICQQTIENIKNLRQIERDYYERLGINLAKVLESWEIHRVAYIRMALSQCEYIENIHNLVGWKSATRDYVKVMKEYGTSGITVAYWPMNDDKIKQLEVTESKIRKEESL